MTMPASAALFILGKALERDANEKASMEALNHIRTSYFEEYTDATEMDAGFAGAFEAIFNVLFPSGEDANGNEVESYLTK